MREMYFWYQKIDINEYNSHKPQLDQLKQLLMLQIQQNMIFSFFGDKMEASDIWTNLKVHNNLEITQTLSRMTRLIE